MNLALMDYPDMRIKPPNYYTQFCNYSYPREPELPSSPFFFSLHRRFPENGREQNLYKRKNDQNVH
jgi:hypothetical protein